MLDALEAQLIAPTFSPQLPPEEVHSCIAHVRPAQSRRGCDRTSRCSSNKTTKRLRGMSRNPTATTGGTHDRDHQPEARADRRRRIIDELRVLPGTPANLAGVTRAGRGRRLRGPVGGGARRDRQGAARRGHRAAEGRPGAAVGERHLRLAARVPGDGRGRQGLDDRARHVGRQPPRRAGRLVQAAVERGARPRLPVADLQERSRAWPDRDLQPVAIRGSRRAQGPSGVARQAEAAAGRSWARVLGRPLRGPERLRAAPRLATARRSSSSSSMSPRPSRSDGSWPGSTTPTSNGSSRPATSRSAPTGTSTCRPTRTRSRQPRPHGRRGTSSRPTTST